MKNKIIAISLLLLYITVFVHNVLQCVVPVCFCRACNHPFELCNCGFFHHDSADLQAKTNSDHQSTHQCDCLWCRFYSERYIAPPGNIPVNQFKQIAALLLLVAIQNDEKIVCPDVTIQNYQESQTHLTYTFYSESFSFRGPPVV